MGCILHKDKNDSGNRSKSQLMYICDMYIAYSLISINHAAFITVFHNISEMTMRSVKVPVQSTKAPSVVIGK